jgi:hypothetical protein
MRFIRDVRTAGTNQRFLNTALDFPEQAGDSGRELRKEFVVAKVKGAVLPAWQASEETARSIYRRA